MPKLCGRLLANSQSVMEKNNENVVSELDELSRDILMKFIEVIYCLLMNDVILSCRSQKSEANEKWTQ